MARGGEVWFGRKVNLEESSLFTEVRKGNSINASLREFVCGSEVKIKVVSEQALLNGSLRAELTN